MNGTPIVVTGAAEGRQGSTGNKVAKMLLERGHSVRAIVHQDDERAKRLRQAGAEVVVADLLEIGDVERALHGSKRIFFTYPVQDGLLDATATVAAIAKAAGFEMVVNVSQLAPAADAATPRMRQHWLSEQVFDWADIGAVHLRATVFYENFRALVAGTIAQNGTMYLPWGGLETVVPLVGAHDVAAVAAEVLSGEVRDGGTRIPLVGNVMTLEQIVQVCTTAFGKPVQYQQVTDEQWRDFASKAGINAHALEHLSKLWQLFRNRTGGTYAVTPSIRAVTGSEPLSLEEFLQQDGAMAVR